MLISSLMMVVARCHYVIVTIEFSCCRDRPHAILLLLVDSCDVLLVLIQCGCWTYCRSTRIHVYIDTCIPLIYFVGLLNSIHMLQMIPFHPLKVHTLHAYNLLFGWCAWRLIDAIKESAVEPKTLLDVLVC